MNQRPYLVRLGRGKVFQARDVRVREAPVTAVKREIDSAIGPIRQLEQVGTDRQVLRVVPVGTVNGAGRERTAGSVDTPRSAAGVKGVLRKLRPQEAAALDAIDAEIAEAEARLQALRTRRHQAVLDAWGRAHVVRLNEVAP